MEQNSRKGVALKMIRKSKDGREVITLKNLMIIYDSWLDDMSPIVNIAGYNFLPSDILKKMNPKGYKNGLKEFYDSGDHYYCRAYEG